MIQHVEAIYENGLFRPLTPVPLAEQERVELAIVRVGEGHNAAEENVLARQQRALDRLRSKIDAIPSRPRTDSLSNRDHDFILYGWKK